MSLEEPLPNAGAAPHPDSKQQLHSQSITIMSLSVSDYCETPPSESQLELDTGTDTHDHVHTPPQLEPQPESEPEPEADAQILEALRSAKDRLFVLKLGESMESLIQDRHIRSRVELTPASTYYKLLVHRCAAYYKLTPETEAGSKAIAIVIASESRIPVRRVADLVPPDDSPLPAFKIMRRTPVRSKTSSQGGSGNDDNAFGTGDTSDGDPSEAGSSRGSRRKPLTMSERQAQYDQARSRIFKDLEDKEKDKAQDMSASSSTLSLLSVDSSSGGAGEGGASSVGESLDETGSMDRDWLPSPGDKKDGGGRTESSTSSSSRSLRSAAPAFSGHGHSPGFNYPTLYEPAPAPAASSSSSHESSSGSAHPPYQPTLYTVYPYGAPPFLAPYPYPYYPYPPHPHAPPPQQHPPDSAGTSASGSPASSPADAYPPPVAFMNPYMWGPPPPPPPLPHQHQPPQPQNQQQQVNQTRPTQPQPQPQPEYPHAQYPHPPMQAYSYPPHAPAPGYLPPLPAHVQSHPYLQNTGRPHSQGPVPESTRATNQHLNHLNGSSSQPQLYHPGTYDAVSSPSSRNGGTGSKRMPARSGWSFGPGVGGPGASLAGEAMGPRVGMGRRISGSNGGLSGFAGSRTPGDETASTASSSTSSSSSRQTFTSSSSKHPLPARPDWAVGLKPQPTLHHSSSHHSSPRSHHGHLPSQSHPIHVQRSQPPMPLQSNDFPPLTVSPPNPEKRPALGGVWAGSSATRSILGPSLGRLNNAPSTNGHGNGVVLNQGAAAQQNARLDEHDRAFERPAPKAGGELFNPNTGPVAGPGPSARIGTKSPPNGVARRAVTCEKDRADKDKDKANARGEAIANAILVDRLGALRIGNEGGERERDALTNGVCEGVTN